MNKSIELETTYINLHNMFMQYDELGFDILKAKDLRNKVIALLEEPYRCRFTSLELFDDTGSIEWKNIMIATAIFKDQLYKYTNIPQNQNDIEIHKLLKARECDDKFELNLAIMIVGDNDNFPYRSSYYITQFFQDLGYNEKHDGTTRRLWVEETLRHYPITDIYKIVKQGLFKKRYFMDSKKDVNIALTEFKNMLEYCYSANDIYDISSVFELNINTELLFNEQVNSYDSTINELIKISRDRFIKGDRQGAVEKIWDALERSKTILNKDKGKGIVALCEVCAINLDTKFFNDEFQLLTNIGNTYQIRHFETSKMELKDNDTLKYLYFRAFSLINFAIRRLNSKYKSEIGEINE